MSEFTGFALVLQHDGSLKVVDAEVVSGPGGTQTFVHGQPAEDLDGYLASGVRREGFDERGLAPFLVERIEEWKRCWAAEQQGRES